MLFAIIFLLCFALLGVFVLWLSKNVDHGEAQFPSSHDQDTDAPKRD